MPPPAPPPISPRPGFSPQSKRARVPGARSRASSTERPTACAGRLRSSMRARCSRREPSMPERRKDKGSETLVPRECRSTSNRNVLPASGKKPAPRRTPRYLDKQIRLPGELAVVTALQATDITVVGGEPSLFRVTQFSMQSRDRLTAVSKYLKERAEATFGVTKPIEVIYNFVDPAVFAPRHESRIRLGGPDTKVLMHPSNFRPVKNSPVVIQVFAAAR